MRFFKFIFFGFVLCFSACSQNQNKQMSNLTSKNYIETMMNSTKRYDYEPIYFLTFVQNSCFSEILVNDIPINKNFKKASQGLTLDINDYIFKSGPQKVTIRLYPVGKIGILNLPTLVNNTEMKIDITEADNKKRDLKGKEISTYITPLATYEADGYEKTRFGATGKDYYEATFTFNATVPYEFNSLDKARDLSQWKKEILEEKVVDFYKNQWNIINEKREDDYFSYLELKEKQTCQSLFYNKTELQETLESYLEAFTIEDYKLQALENYTLKFYGNGKLVCLELASLESKMRGKSALWSKFDENRTADFLKYYLYIPEGEDELKILR
ncbi:hypothetical protein [Flavobacterium fluviale]|uniref:Uncharacterized protein n=1 Tax=Flavobacterium fluviale TaxID=2249356 RepID=A0A344LQ72_9FLAO|nr:hypothetical protein [Flavobacterium fluviale]AXB56064.1 hypothetical protein HYN86_05395 [Flavobacterium fluviale]